MFKNQEMMERDLRHVWHPCTQMKDHERLPIIPIKNAKGVYLYDFEENSYIDAISSWWVNIFGHCNSYINSKVKEQLDSLEHVIMAGFSHEQVIRLSERLVKLTPEGLNRCFFADNGSSAVEIALKMSFHAHKNRGEIRPLFVSLENSYHGETLGALAVGDVKLYKETYEDVIIKTLQTPIPKGGEDDDIFEALEALEDIFYENEGKISAFIVEPLLQCAGGMRIYPEKYLNLARNLCKKYNIYFIADEVATGFGRTGEMFACNRADITPDFLCLSKALTGGYLPLSVVLSTEEVYEAFYAEYLEFKAFLHSHSFTGNPLACAAANATLDIFESENIIEKNREKSFYIEGKLNSLRAFKNIENIRSIGMVSAFDLKGYRFEDRMGLKLYELGLKRGVLIRPLGNTIYFMPPYVIKESEIDKVFSLIEEFLKSL